MALRYITHNASMGIVGRAVSVSTEKLVDGIAQQKTRRWVRALLILAWVWDFACCAITHADVLTPCSGSVTHKSLPQSTTRIIKQQASVRGSHAFSHESVHHPSASSVTCLRISCHESYDDASSMFRGFELSRRGGK